MWIGGWPDRHNDVAPERKPFLIEIKTPLVWRCSPEVAGGFSQREEPNAKAKSPRMNRRDIDSLALGATLSPLLAKPLFAQTSRDQTQSLPLTKVVNRESIASRGCPRGEAVLVIFSLANSTTFTTLFGGTESLDCFWFNLAMRT
jgi:hypothetical protein